MDLKSIRTDRGETGFYASAEFEMLRRDMKADLALMKADIINCWLLAIGLQTLIILTAMIALASISRP